jgi:glycosyltransferase involved in cell wall biosynthesis
MSPDDRVARISLVLHKFSRGGSDRVAAHLARGFADRGAKVDLVVLADGGEVEGVLTDLAGADIPIRYLGRPSGNRPLDLLVGLPRLIKQLRRDQPDVVISTANNMALVTAIAVRRAGLGDARLFVKTTNPIASSRHRGLARAFRRWTYRLIFKWTDAVWTLSAEESAEMREAFPTFTPLFRDIAQPYVTPAMLSDPGPRGHAQGRTVISIARLTEQKRLDRLIRAFARVRTPDTRLLILGEGESRAALTALTVQLGIADRVAMPGYLTDVAAALHAAHLFVLPSDYEGLPAAVLEAMAANCPVLSTDCFPSARTLVGSSEGCAIIDRPDDDDQFAALIDDYLARPRPIHLRAIAERYTIANGVASHWHALQSGAAEPVFFEQPTYPNSSRSI